MNSPTPQPESFRRKEKSSVRETRKPDSQFPGNIDKVYPRERQLVRIQVSRALHPRGLQILPLPKQLLHQSPQPLPAEAIEDESLETASFVDPNELAQFDLRTEDGILAAIDMILEKDRGLNRKK